MGTRNLTMVINTKGETKIGQYGQWDGYPAGQGVTCLEFLRGFNREKFIEQLEKIKLFSHEEHNDFLTSIGFVEGSYVETPEQTKLYNEKFPYYSRNHGGEILSLINDSELNEINLLNKSDFAGDGIFCEWGYVIDLQKNTFEVYEGFGKTPLEDDQRFKYLEETDEFKKDVEERQSQNREVYYPIRMIKSYDLNNLPTKEEFLNELEPNEE